MADSFAVVCWLVYPSGNEPASALQRNGETKRVTRRPTCLPRERHGVIAPEHVAPIDTPCCATLTSCRHYACTPCDVGASRPLCQQAPQQVMRTVGYFAKLRLHSHEKPNSFVFVLVYSIYRQNLDRLALRAFGLSLKSLTTRTVLLQCVCGAWTPSASTRYIGAVEAGNLCPLDRTRHPINSSVR